VDDKISFNAIPGCTGRYQSEYELVIRAPNTRPIKKLLTMTNKSAIWQANFLKRKIKHFREKLIPLQEATNTTAESLMSPRVRDAIAATESKIASLQAQLDEVPPFKEELFTELDSGELVVPPGMWWLCESIEGDAHKNREIAPFCLPECRVYQSEAVLELMKYYRGTLEMATGLGKSKIIMSIALSLVRAGLRVMIVVPTEYLVGQMYDQLKALYNNVTAQGGKRKAEPGWDILVTTINSAPGFADLPHAILFDEAHHMSAATWTKLAVSAINAKFVYNFTATAFRADGLDMAIHSFAGPVVFSRDVIWGITNDWLSPFTAFSIIVHPRRDGRKISLKDRIPSATAYKILSNCFEAMQVARDKIMKGLEKGRKVIVIYSTVESCKKFRQFCEGVVTMDVASAVNGAKSKAPLVRFQKGTSRVLLANSKLISEGVDIPDADMLVILTQHASDVSTLQMLGRVLRKSPGKTNAIVIDVQVSGYNQYERSGDKRRALYAKIVGENLKVIELE
jgi:superfamily II DNA or RNA helicase